jgi:flagellar biosynthesis protein FlhG
VADQAEKLRELVRSKAKDTVPESASVMDSEAIGKKKEKKARIIAVTSGKGGVGKTSVATNLAIEMAMEGKRVIVFDADLSLANIDVLLGLRPQYNLHHVINGEKNIEDILISGPHGIRIIPASSGIVSLANLSREGLDRLMGQFSRIEKDCDFLIVDTAAGISDSVMAFVASADQAIVVTTPEPTAYTDAYALIKILAEQSTSTEIGLLINMAASRKEALNAASGIILISKQFLQIGVRDFGFVLRDPEVPRAVRRQEAFVLYNPMCAASRSIRQLAGMVASSSRVNDGSGRRGFMEKIASFFRGE